MRKPCAHCGFLGLSVLEFEIMKNLPNTVADLREILPGYSEKVNGAKILLAVLRGLELAKLVQANDEKVQADNSRMSIRFSLTQLGQRNVNLQKKLFGTVKKILKDSKKK